MSAPSDWQETAQAAVTRYGAQQKPDELAAFLHLVAAADPQVILEIGSDAGGTLYAWSRLPSAPRVIAVSLPGQAYSRTGHGPRLHGAVLAEGDSHDPAILARVRVALRGRRVDMLFIDADHTYAAARADFETFSPLVRGGGLIVFHDICGIADVRRLWNEVRAGMPHTEIITGRTDWGGFGILTVPAWRPVRQRRNIVAEQKKTAETPAEQAAAQTRVLQPAGASTDPHVHQALAERQIAVLNDDGAAIAAADEKLAALGVT